MSFCFYRIRYLLIRLLKKTLPTPHILPDPMSSDPIIKKPLPTPHIFPDPISFDPDNRTIPL